MADVRDFGAAGDGRTDDTEAIQHAVDQRGGHLILPPGTYRLTKPIVVPLDRDGPFGMDGSGGTARLVMAGPGPALRLVGTHEGTAAPDSVEPVVWESERRPGISDLEIVGDHEEAVGIELDGTMMATIAGVLIRRCLYGVHLVRRNRNVLLADSHIYEGRGPAIGVYFDGVDLHQTIIVGSHISYQKHAGIKVRGSEVRNLQITGCDIEYNFDPESPNSADVWIDAREGRVREGTIASNTIQAKESPDGANVRIEGPDDPTSKGAGLWTIVGNVLQSQAVNLMLRNCRGVAVTGNSFASGFRRSIEMDRCQHVVIGANTFDHNPDYTGDRIDGVTIRRSAGVCLSGLILEGSKAGDANEGGALEIYDSSEVNVNGCQVLDPVHRGIELRNLRNSRISDCTVIDRRAEPSMQEGIRVRECGPTLMISDNLVGSGRRDGLRIDACEPTTSNNNNVAIAERPGKS